jgi:hypothetical protein
MFRVGQIVRHKNGGKYTILSTPNPSYLLEHNCESFYSYMSKVSGIVWLRCKSEMEDGRFIAAEVN